MKESREREIAVYALIDITEHGGYNNVVIRKALNKNDALTQVQKAFITEIVNGTLRNIILIDHIINQFSNTKTTKMKPLILNILRISVYQMKWMDKTPIFAICNEAVKLTKRKGFVNLSGFVNGVLRSISRNLDNIELPDKEVDIVAYLSTIYSYPKWMIEKFIDYFDNDIDTVENMLKTNAKAPKITVCVNTLKTDKKSLIDILESEGVKVSESKMLDNALNIEGTSNMTLLQSFKEGLFHVIDESAMQCINILNPKKGQTLLDICAAPGGKSFYSAILMQNSGNIISRDLHEHKIMLMEESKNRLGIDILETQLYDATVFDESMEEKADLLLIDAPCSGFGLARKKPDIKFTKTVEDIQNLVQLQRQILSASWKYVKKGGAFVYSTCTLTKDENIDNINWFISNFPFVLDDIKPYISESIDFKFESKGHVTILPQEYGTDGFFIARLIRTV